ncbi:MAG: hypothetical protein GXO79_09245 [Chlorobi bacterium]|nr:hypothetical protein [Chlorobiota bacterium]
MKKIVHYSQILSLALILLANGSIYGQKKGKIHIQIEGDKEKIDTVINFNGNIAEEELQSIISAVTGEDMNVKMHKKGNHKMILISDDDIDMDFDFNTDSLMKEIHNKMKMYEFNGEDVDDSIFKSLNIKIDSLNNFVLNINDDFDFSWTDDSINGKHMFVFKDDTCIMDIDSLIKRHSSNKKVIVKTIGDSEDIDEIIMELKNARENKNGKVIVKTITAGDNDDIEQVIIITDKDGKSKQKIIHKEETTKKDTLKKKHKKRKDKTIKVEIEMNDEK